MPRKKVKSLQDYKFLGSPRNYEEVKTLRNDLAAHSIIKSLNDKVATAASSSTRTVPYLKDVETENARKLNAAPNKMC